MRRILYIVLFALASSIAISACTEEEVVPTDRAGGGGGTLDPM